MLAVENASRDDERRVLATIAELAAHPERLGLKSPAVLIFGEVAGLPGHGVIEDILSLEEVKLPNVVTANRLTDGIVVYLAPDGSWTEEIARARFAETEDETSALEARANQAVKDRIVVAMYPMPVEIKDGAVDRAVGARAHPRGSPHHTDQGLVRCTAMTSSTTLSCANAWRSSKIKSSAGWPAS